jgi:selenocysteine lyase/cysteine desulfurase
MERRGGTIAFNFCDPSGAVLDCYQIQEDANQCGLSLRSGCFCNPGVREIALDLEREDLVSAFRQKEHISYEQFLHVIDGRTQGAVRVSVGLATNFSDVYRFLRFTQSIIDRFTSSPPAEQTRFSPESSLPVCLCGYSDTRWDKQFCPRCGRPAL